MSEAQDHSTTVGGSTPTVGYGYDVNNGDRLTSITYPGLSRTITYNYDGNSGLDSTASRISSISDGNPIQSYGYQGLGTPVQATSNNGIQSNTQFDRFGRISSLTYTLGTAVVDGFGYTYDENGNVKTKIQLATAMAGNSETYNYDSLNRLTNFYRGTISSGTISTPTTSGSWNYDALGNWNSNTVNGGTPVSRTNNAQNQITSVTGATTSPTYDANGNTLKDPTGQQYVYDGWNRLVTVKNAGGTPIAGYTYDALGRRISETHGSTTTDLYYSNRWQVIEERDRASGTTTAQYVWSPFYVDQMAERDDQPVTTSGVTTLTRRLYVQQDANFNVTSLTDINGNVVERYVYDPYGAVIVMNSSGVPLTSSTVGWIYLYQGLRRDFVTGTDDNRFRVGIVSLGRFAQQDPTGAAYVNGPNNYQLELSNPVNGSDPAGLSDDGFFSNLWVVVFGPPDPTPGTRSGGYTDGNGDYHAQTLVDPGGPNQHLVETTTHSNNVNNRANDPFAHSIAEQATANETQKGQLQKVCQDNKDFDRDQFLQAAGLNALGGVLNGAGEGTGGGGEGDDNSVCPNSQDESPRQPGGDEEPHAAEGTGAKFADDAKLQGHFNDHGGDFGAKTPGEYQAQADNFLTGSKPNGVLEKVRANGDVVRYNPATDEFGVVSKNGAIRTYYKPNPAIHGYPTNLDYFNAQ